MKNIVVFLFFVSITCTVNAQLLSNIDEVSHFQEGLAGVKKGQSWGFIDTEGTLVIDYRKDIVATSKKPPAFSSGLCLIQETKEGITYFGYINASGEKIIPTEYLAATAFENGFARVIKYYKTDTGATNALGKNIVKDSYNELVIDTENKIVQHLRGPHSLFLDKQTMQKNPPTINSTFIGDHIIAVQQNDNTFSVYKLKKQ